MRRTCFYKIARIVVFIASLFIIISLFYFSGQGIIHSVASTPFLTPVKLTEGWQYRLGDSSVNSKGVPLWAINSDLSPEWKAYNFSEPPPDRNRYKVMWLRVKISESALEESCLYFSTAYQTFEVYAHGRLVFKFGEVDPSGKKDTGNSTWSIIPLKSSYTKSYLYFRVYSIDSSHLGNFLEVRLSSAREVLTNLVKGGIEQLVLAFFFTITGLFMIAIFLMKKGDEKAFVHLGIFSMCVGICLISLSKLNCFLFDSPSIWFYIRTISMCLAPVGIISFVEQVFSSKLKWVYRYARNIFIFYTFITLALSALNILPLYKALNIFCILWFITTPILFIAPLKQAFKGNLNARTYTFGSIFLLLSTIYDMLGGTLRFFPWSHGIFPWGMLIFVISMMLILVQRFFEVHDKLKVYSSEIEVKNVTLSKMWKEVKQSRDTVAERNAALEERSRELETVNSELLILLDALQKTQAQLVQSEKMAALGNLVAGIAHEINTPLGIGVTAASYIERKTQEFIDLYNTNKMKKSDLENHLKVCTETIRMILSNLEKSSELVRSFKQIASDRYTEEKRRFNVKEYLNEVLISLRPELKKTKHNITVNCSDELIIYSYPGSLYQILNNFIMNSLIHAYDEESEGNIYLSVDDDDGKVLLKYRDDGKGMDKRTMDKIFDPFFTTRRGNGGTGLGLHIVYNIVTKTLGGSIKCASEPGKGTTFILTFPIKEDILQVQSF